MAKRDRKPTNFNMRVEPDFVMRLDIWIGRQMAAGGGKLSRAEALRRMMDRCITMDETTQFGQPLEQAR